jgi:hypothetical protein
MVATDAVYIWELNAILVLSYWSQRMWLLRIMDSGDTGIRLILLETAVRSNIAAYASGNLTGRYA